MTERVLELNPFKASQLEEADKPPHIPTDNATLGKFIGRPFSRRSFLQGSLAISAIGMTVGPMALLSAGKAKAAAASSFNFPEVEAGVDATDHVAEANDADILLRWREQPFQTRRNSTLYIRQQRLRQSDYAVKMITWDTFRLREAQRMDCWW